jgi:hypothetical protein
MEKDFCVECWGSFADDWGTEIFYTEKEAIQYFKKIRKGLSLADYIITKESIIDRNDDVNSVVLSNLSEL